MVGIGDTEGHEDGHSVGCGLGGGPAVGDEDSMEGPEVGDADEGNEEGVVDVGQDASSQSEFVTDDMHVG